MNILYICKVTATQASKQIDIPKKIAINFFGIPEETIINHGNFIVNVCHKSDLKNFEEVEIQTATNVRWSTKLRSLLAQYNEDIETDDLLLFEKIGRLFCVRNIKSNDNKYSVLEDLFDENENHMLINALLNVNDKRTTDFEATSFQQIYYGAPGTGKSHTINELTKGESVIRTTFHPDSDYSTFVGAYKPTTKEIVLRDVSGNIIMEGGERVTEERIVYEFVQQAFLQAYVKAWEMIAEAEKNEAPQKQFLVIEEINRGNCAQIFGDLFQLLDRNDAGFSDYPIQADNDMRKQLKKAFEKLTIATAESINSLYNEDDIVGKVLSGEILLLPNNLYIWATMNTSDQSLFPIDSAFKRRWDWQYVPISKGRDKNGNELEWSIEGDTKKYDWWDFLDKINARIGSSTNSEDKKLGFFFCKAKDGVISTDTFVGKVIFYLWNDVYKDMYQESGIFQDKEGKELTFTMFYDVDSKGKTIVCKDKVEAFLDNLGVDIVSEETNDDIDSDSEEAGKAERKETLVAVTLNGVRMDTTEKSQFDLYIDVIKQIGAEEAGSVIESLKYHREGSPLATKIPIPNLKDHTYVQEGEYHFLKGAKPYTLIRVLEDLKAALKLDMTIEYK